MAIYRWAGRVYQIIDFRQLWFVKPAPTEISLFFLPFPSSLCFPVFLFSCQLTTVNSQQLLFANLNLGSRG